MTRRKKDDEQDRQTTHNGNIGLTDTFLGITRDWITVLFFMLVGGFLRFYQLGLNALWLDEAATIRLSQGGFWQIWQNTVAGEFNPPLFHWIEYAMMGAFGNNEFVLRFVPAFFGMMAIPLFYLIGLEFKDKYAGYIMAAACAFSPFLIYYSQEARAYSILLFLIAATTLFFFRGLRTNDIKDWVAFTVLGAVAFWTHFYALVFVLAMFGYLWIIAIRECKSMLIYLTRVGGYFCLWILLTFPLLAELGQLFAKRTLTAPTYGIQGIGIVYDTFRGFSAFSDLVLIIFLALFVMGIIWIYMQDRKRAGFMIWIFPVVFLFSLGASYVIPMLPRYLIFMSIFFYLGIACSYGAIRKVTKWEPMQTAMTIIVLIGLMAVPFVSTYYAGETKDDWRGVSAYLETVTVPGDSVIAIPNYIELPLSYYYASFFDDTDMWGVSTVAELERARYYQNGTIWYVVTPDISAVDTSGNVTAWLSQNARIKRQFRGGIIVLRGV